MARLSLVGGAAGPVDLLEGMMGWHYQMRKRRLSDGSDWFDMVECYENPTGWTKDGMSPGSSSADGLIFDLEMMLKDARRYPILEDMETPS